MASLTTTQLQGTARLADALAAGAWSAPVENLGVRVRPDGLADVYVNGELVDYAMDESGHPVNAR